MLKELLIKEGYLPLSGKRWNKIKIDHTVESIPTKKGYSKVKRFISSQTKGKFGVYIYTNSRKAILYIGQGNIEGRLRDHYNKSHKEYTNKKNQRWHDFFSSHREVLDVYYTEVEDGYDSIALEAMLTKLLQPEYINWL